MEDNNDEEFKKFLNYEFIKVSKNGKVMFNGEILPQTTDNNGYNFVNIPNFVHRLVALTWLYDKYEKGKGLHVHHKDGDKLNNHVDNLEWITEDEHFNEKHGEIVVVLDYP